MGLYVFLCVRPSGPDELVELRELSIVCAARRGDVAVTIRELIGRSAFRAPSERWSPPSLQMQLCRESTVSAVPIGPWVDPHELVMEPCGEFVERITTFDDRVVLRRGIRE